MTQRDTPTLERILEKAERVLQSLLARASAPPAKPTAAKRSLKSRSARRPRDSQRSRVYAAERGVPQGAKFKGFAECRAYVDGIVASGWWREKFPHVPTVEVKDGRGRRHAGGSAQHRFVTLPRWARNELIVLHELAHVVDAPNNPGHGPEFARLYLEFVREWRGESAAARLEASFEAHGVKVTADESAAGAIVNGRARASAASPGRSPKPAPPSKPRSPSTARSRPDRPTRERPRR